MPTIVTNGNRSIPANSTLLMRQIPEVMRNREINLNCTINIKARR
ncbi:hypothetical protein DDI_3105 [Dickeya dianthicola RNS04.9]|nr:hypothetical protein DDI_3105 [Dickeya dianthicola RNS04.9]